LTAASGARPIDLKEKTMKMQRCKLAVIPLALIFLADLRAVAQDHTALAGGAAAEDRPNTHNMLVVGKEAVFLSHLPMFDGLNEQATDYTSAHRYQVILEVNFTQNGQDVSDLYTKDRQGSPGTKMYTLMPEKFVLARLFTPDAQNPALSSFKATVFHGHLERPNNHVIGGLQDALVTVKKVIHAQKLDPAAIKPDKLPYFLFGKGEELFLAHVITKPPDFDQIVSVKMADHPFTEEELNRGVSVIFPDRANAAPQRLKENQQARGQAQVTGTNQRFDVQVQTGTEYYFEEGELAIPPLMHEQTPEEAKSGF
jgi:hypothetical protein